MRLSSAHLRPLSRLQRSFRSGSLLLATRAITTKMAPATALDGPKEVTEFLEGLNTQYEKVGQWKGSGALLCALLLLHPLVATHSAPPVASCRDRIAADS
jgi:hypothetical protein